MKILLIHYRYFIVGGPEKYMFNIMDKLEREGHEVIPFSVKSSKNMESKYSNYFVDPIGDEASIYYAQYKKTPRVICQLLKRSFYDKKVKYAVKKVIQDTNPDIVYIMCYLNKLSPSVIMAAKEMKKKVVIRLSEYGLMCPNYSFLYQGDLCEKCAQNGYYECVRRKCVQNSMMASVVRVLSMKFHDSIHIYDKVDAFITPSEFLKFKLEEYKFKNKKIYHIPTFTGKKNEVDFNQIREEYGLYFGRIEKEKGVEYLIEAYELLGTEYKLIIAGNKESLEAKRLISYVESHGLNNIVFVGFKSGKELEEIIKKAKFVLVPSIWYDNFPNVVLEAFFYSKPVLASNLGSLPEMVKDHENGMLFEMKNSKSIADTIMKLDNPEIVDKMSENAYMTIRNKFSEEQHYQKLMKVFSEVLN